MQNGLEELFIGLNFAWDDFLINMKLENKFKDKLQMTSKRLALKG